MKYLRIAPALLVAASCSGGLSIVGFNASRGGGFSLADGWLITQLRSAVQSAFPGVLIGSIGELSDPPLAASRVTVLMSTKTGVVAISPLAAAEQKSLLASVVAGRGAVLFSDNETFAGGASQPANLSLLASFGVTSEGTGDPWQRGATVSNPASSPVTNGKFGRISSFSVGWTGWFANTGGGNVLATANDNGKPVLLGFPRGSFGPGSGAVVIFADCTMTADGFLTSENQNLILNALAYAAGMTCPGDLSDDGQVDDPDFSIFVVAYDVLDCADPTMPADCPADLNRDGLVDDSDFVIFIAAYDALLCP